MITSSKESRKRKFNERFGIDFRKLFTITSMLLKDKTKISFKANKKQSLIKLISSLVLFIVIIGASSGFYYVAKKLNLFSILSFVPLSVPSFLSTFILILSFIGIVIGLIEFLYFSNDNRLLITYPCNGNTIFVARVLVYFINEYIKNILIQVPLFLGYMIIMGFPWYSFLIVFVVFFFITILEVLLASIISIPGYYVSMFLKKNYIVRSLVLLIVFTGIIVGISYLLVLMPSKIDIFTNWGPYFERIQQFLNGYKLYLYPFYCLTILICGTYNGFNIVTITPTSIYTFLVIFASIIILLVIVNIVVNPLYFKFSSKSFEVENNFSFGRKKNTKLPYWLSQIKKETKLLLKNLLLLSSILFSFVLMPLIITFINKIFGAMKLSITGEMYSQIVNLLIILLISLSSNTAIARAYSIEGEAFVLDRTYPRKSYYMLFSKLIFPLIVGSLSIIISGILFANLRHIDSTSLILFIVGTLSLYIGHMLYSAQLDFCNVNSTFVNDNFENKSTKASSFLAIIIPLIVSFLFFYYIKDGNFSGYLKYMILGVLFLVFFVFIFIQKIRLIYQEGQ